MENILDVCYDASFSSPFNILNMKGSHFLVVLVWEGGAVQSKGRTENLGSILS
jgi:hypothetical protein